MDKLKYIKLEQQDGSYSDAIPLAVDSDHVDVNGDKLTAILSLKANTEDVNESLSNLQSEINSLESGSPFPASSISEMTDRNKIYVNTTDGNWYYYDGTQWTIGGIYQAAVDSNEIENIEKVLIANDMMKIETVEMDPAKENYYISKSGSFTYSTNYNCSQIISLKAGEKISFTGYSSTSVGAIVEYPGGFGASYNPYNVLVDGISSNDSQDTYSYIADSDIDVFICYNKNHNVSNITINRINIVSVQPSILFVKDSSTSFSVYSWHQNKKRYIRHTFKHEITTSNKTTTGDTMETQNCWFAAKIMDGENQIAQGNTNFIHNLYVNNEQQGYSGQGDGSCKAIYSNFFIDGNLIDFDNILTNQKIIGEKFTFMTRVENYLCTGGGTEDSANYRTVVENGEFIVESTNNIIYNLTAGSNINVRNTLNIKRNNTQFYECFCAMSCGYYPYFDNIIINSEIMDWNQFVLSEGHFTANEQYNSTLMPYTSIKADTVTIFGNNYKMTTRALPVNGDNKVNSYLKTYATDGRLKTYLLPCICHVSEGTTETFNNGDKFDFIVTRSLELK